MPSRRTRTPVWALFATLAWAAPSLALSADLDAAVCGPIPTSLVRMGLNLDASLSLAGANGPFEASHPTTTSDFQQTFTALDSLGARHPITVYFMKTPAPNNWEWVAALRPAETTTPPAAPTDLVVVVGRGALSFDSAGGLQSVSGSRFRIDVTGGAEPGQLIEIDFGPIAGVGSGEPTTQFAGESAIHSIEQDGESSDSCRFADYLKVAVRGPVTLLPDAVVWVTVYGSREVPVRALARRSLRFGPGRVRPLDGGRRGFWRRHMRDLNGDGVEDLLLRFPTRGAGLQEQGTQACLDGLVAGRVFQACQYVSVCGPWCQREIDPRKICGPTATSRARVVLHVGEADRVTGSFDPADPFGMSAYRTWLTLYDSLGTGHPVSIFVSRILEDLWEWSVAISPSDTVLPPARPWDPLVHLASGEISVDEEGRLVPRGSSTVSFDFSGGAAANQDVEFEFLSKNPDYTRPYAWWGPTFVSGTTQDGQAPGRCRVEVVEGPPRSATPMPTPSRSWNRRRHR